LGQFLRRLLVERGAVSPFCISSRTNEAVLDGVFRRFKDEFVVDLQQLLPQFFCSQSAVDSEHRELDHVGGGALNYAVYAVRSGNVSGLRARAVL